MGFDAQAFATAFLTDQAKEIKARFAKAEEYEEEQKKKAERNLTIFQKRRKEKNVLKQYAATLQKLGATNEQIMYFAKDGPLALKSIHDAMSAKAAKLGEKLSEQDISEMMEIPQGFEKAAGKYKTIDEFLEASYRLSEEHDKVEPPETPESIKGNWLLGVMGIGAKDNVDRKLETEKYLGDLTIGQINRVAAQDDFVNVFGDTFGTAALDPTAGPTIVSQKNRIDLYDKYTTKKNSKQNTTEKIQNRVLDLIKKKEYKDEDGQLAIAVTDAIKNDNRESLKNEEALKLFDAFNDDVNYEALTETIRGLNYTASEVTQIDAELGQLYKKFNPTDQTEKTEKSEEKPKQESKTGLESFTTKSEVQSAIRNKILDGSLKEGDTFRFMYKGKEQFNKITKEKIDQLGLGTGDVKEAVKEKEEETTIEPDMSEEQFNALEERVDPKPGILYVADRNKWIKQYGKTHNDDGTKKSYKEYTTGQTEKKGIMTKGQRRKESRTGK